MADYKNVHMALAAAQAEITDPKKTGLNKHFGNKYFRLNDLIKAARPTLSKHGLAFYWTTEPGETQIFEVAHIYHGASDTHIKSPVPLLASSNNMQAFKAAQTYARRMGLAGLCGLDADDEDDDDGNAAVGNNAAANGLRDAWKDGVLDSLPEDATPRQKAEAFAQAICDDFQGKGEKALANSWGKRKSLIAEFEKRYPDLHEKVVDAFMTREVELADAKRETVPE
jgi:hypothetical protein